MEQSPKIYTCPMHPEVRKDSPGLCPGCGMALIPADIGGMAMPSHQGHKNHKKAEGTHEHQAEMTNPQMAKKMEQDMRRRFWVSFLLSIPVVFGANIFSLGTSSLPREYLLAALVSFAVGLTMINLSYKYVLSKKKNFMWFGFYCLLLSLILGIWLILT
jgi:cation transport ATPase